MASGVRSTREGYTTSSSNEVGNSFWMPILLFAAALVVRFAAISLTQFDGVYGQDPFAYFNYVIELREAISSGQPPPPFFWPLGYPILATFASWFTGARPFSGQLVSIIAGSAIAPLVYLIVVELRKNAHTAAVLVGVSAAVAGQLLISSLSFMSDAAGLGWATFSALALLRYRRNIAWRWLLAAAAALTAAVLTRWAYALLIVPWSLSTLMIWSELGVPAKQHARHLGATAALVTTIFLAHFAAAIGRGEISHMGDLGVVHWHPANAFATSVSNADGQFTYERPMAVYYALPAVHPSYVFPLFTPFMLVGALGLRRRTRSTAVLLAGWPLFIYLFLAGISWQNWRFPLPYFPALMVLLGLGLDQVLSRVKRKLKVALIGLSALTILGSLTWAGRDVGRFAEWAESREQVAYWVANLIPQDATLVAFDLTLEIRHYTKLEVVELFEQDFETLADMVGSNSRLYLILDPETAQAQWEGKPPGRNFAWLSEHAQLTEIGRQEPFVLFEVKR